MTAFDQECDVPQGYDYKKGSNTAVGYITEMVIAGQTLPADQTTIKDPQNPDALLGSGVVAVLSSASWGTGPTDPMYFEGQISEASMQTMRAFMTKTTDVSVKFRFCVYGYDSAATKMFKSFHKGDAQVKGLIEKKGGQQVLTVSSSPCSYPPKPKTFLFSIGILPGEPGQSVQLATSDAVKFNKQWG